MLKLFSFVLVLAVVNAAPYTDCGSKGSTISAVNVQGCTGSPCVLKRGSSVELEIEYTPTINSPKLITKVYGILGGLKVPWSGLPSDACTGTACPVTGGQKAIYKNEISVLASYPPIAVTVQFEFKASPSNEMVMCFQIPVRLA